MRGEYRERVRGEHRARESEIVRGEYRQRERERDSERGI